MTPRRPLLAALLGAALAAPAAATPPSDGLFAPAAASDSARAALRPGLGRSGSLRVAVVQAMQALELPTAAPAGAAGTRYRWEPLLGTRPEPLAGEAVASGAFFAPAAPGVWRLAVPRPMLAAFAPPAAGAGALDGLAVITRVPFSAKRDGRLNGYRIGTYPGEDGRGAGRYALPVGFIEVTRENQELQLSEHFRLRQFLTKDQFDVWPKYLVLDLRLIDKLELVIQELNAMGVRAERMHVMSGYRTPQYNGPGGDGRAALSRHMYGDAADVWVDNDGDGYIDDLNSDGRRDIEDAKLIRLAVERVEQRYPELAGGCGVYYENAAHGPFVHIDTRGHAVRW